MSDCSNMTTGQQPSLGREERTSGRATEHFISLCHISFLKPTVIIIYTEKSEKELAMNKKKII